MTLFSRHLRIIVFVLAMAFAVVGAVHLACLFIPTLLPPSPTWRHAVFVGVNLYFAVALEKGLPGLRLLLPLFVFQQTLSHGSSFLESLHHGPLDLVSLAVLAFLVFTLAVVFSNEFQRFRGKNAA